MYKLGLFLWDNMDFEKEHIKICKEIHIISDHINTLKTELQVLTKEKEKLEHDNFKIKTALEYIRGKNDN